MTEDTWTLPAGLIACLAENRFMPCPPESLKFCGDGDFRAIGAEFLGHFVRVGGLARNARVLDIGCGVGRMAVPLTQWLTEPGASYDGVDVVREGIEWCAEAITPAYPSFRFRHLDFAHGIYNPGGSQGTTAAKLPFDDGSFDFIVMTSVLTHLAAAEVTHYAREAARLLAPGGTCFATAFLYNAPAREALANHPGTMGFPADAQGPEVHLDPDHPMAAVAYDEDFLLEKFLRHGLRRQAPGTYGNWSGRASSVFQDICVFRGG